MNGRDFLPLALHLSAEGTEAAWRSAISRAYYAAFHVARRLLRDLRFVVPRSDRAHPYLVYRLSNCGELPVAQAGLQLESLRRQRNQADYDEGLTIPQRMAGDAAHLAQQVIAALDAARQQPIRTQITDAMKIYERNVLQDVTWQP